MSHRPAHLGRLAAILGALTLGIAACTGGAGPAGSSPTATPASQASDGAPGLDLPSVEIPSFESDVELEARLPSEFCGQETQKFSFAGADIVSDDEDFAAMVTQLGRSPADVSVATAGVEGPECAGINLIAFRIAGADPGNYERLFIAAQAADSGVQPTKTNVGGRDVWTFTDADGAVNYIYFSGDTAFGVTAATEADAARGLAALP
jgi:hypothetical protein